MRPPWRKAIDVREGDRLLVSLVKMVPTQLDDECEALVEVARHVDAQPQLVVSSA
jgi:hypothetical protein